MKTPKKTISLSYDEYVTILTALQRNLQLELQRDEDDDLDETVINELCMLRDKIQNKLN